MKKRLAAMLFFGVAAMLLASYSNASDDPNIIVKSGNVIINAIVEQGADEAMPALTDERLFQSWMSSHSEIPYVQLGDSITITANQDLTGSYEVSDVLLKKDGALKYSTQHSVEPSHVTNIQFEEGVGSFVLTENMYAYLSSQSADYEPGATIRGFKLYLEETEESLIFVIRTDARIAQEKQIVFECISVKPS